MSRMIDADALIDNIKTFSCIDCERRKGMKNGKLKFLYEIGDVPCRACDVADMIDTIDEAQTVGGWISVKDRLPEDAGIYIICDHYGNVMSRHFCKKSDKFAGYWHANGSKFYGNPTHWMPLPEPPKEEKDDA